MSEVVASKSDKADKKGKADKKKKDEVDTDAASEKPEKSDKKKNKKADSEESSGKSDEKEKKKKKKKDKEDADEEEKPKKKKDKKKKDKDSEDGDDSSEETDKKKKKKKDKKKKDEDEEEEDNGEEAGDDDAAEDTKKEEDEDLGEEEILDFEATLAGKKKKKKKEKKTEGAEASEDSADPWADSDRDYTYTELLDRVFTLLREKNPLLAQKKRHVLPPPQIVRVGTKKVMWSNFSQICSLMHRQPEHVMSFVLAELGSEGSIDGNQRLVIKGRWVGKQMESLLKKYILEYVTCSMCHTPETTLTRDSVTRLYFIQCETCGSRRSVAPIKTGFHATGRGDRRRAQGA